MPSSQEGPTKLPEGKDGGRDSGEIADGVLRRQKQILWRFQWCFMEKTERELAKGGILSTQHSNEQSKARVFLD